MESKELRLKQLFYTIQFIEALYLFTVIYIIWAPHLPSDKATLYTSIWITISYMLLPVFLVKNIIAGILQNDEIDRRHKGWLIVRCIIYLILAFYSYPLISHLDLNSVSIQPL